GIEGERSGTRGAPSRRGLLDGNRIGRRKGVLEGFVERLFLAPTLIAIAIVLIRFAFRIGNHFGFSDGADEDLQGYDANFGALLDELLSLSRHPVAVQHTRGDTSIGSFPITRQGWKLMRRQSAGASITATPFFTDFCTFSKARTSIWRTRSRDTPNSAAKSSSVIGSSASRRASKMRRSRSLSTESASPSAFLRLSDSSSSTSRVS